MDNLAIERIVQRQIKANERVLKEIGKIIGMIGDLNPSEAYTLAQQLKYGESLEKIVKILSQNSQLTEVEIYKMLEHEAKTNLALKEIYFKAKQKDFIPYEENLPLQNLVREVALATVGTYRNISMTTGITFLDRNKNVITKPLTEAYYQIVDDAIMNVSLGKETFWQTMKDQLKTIGNSGIQSIQYETGYHRRIDSALRMNLSDGLNELSQKQQELIGEQFGYDGIEISVHENPAEDHADVQGHIFTLEEYEKLNNFGEATDVNGKFIDIHNKYGDFRQIGTLNCYHEIFTIVIGVSKPRYTQKELNKINANNKKGFEFDGKHYTMYDGTQLQRKLELEMRKNEEEIIILKAGGQDTTKEKERQRHLLNKYHELSKISGLGTRLERIKAML
jgi:hypothetical protein